MSQINSLQFVWGILVNTFHLLVTFWPIWVVLLLVLALRIGLDLVADRTARWF